MGDLNPTNPFYYTNIGAGLFYKYNFNSTWGLKLAFNQLSISARDQDFKNVMSEHRKLSFNNHISELSLLTEFNYFNYHVGRKRKNYSPYLLGGIGIIKHSPYVNYGGNKFSLRELNIERNKDNNPIDYSLLALVIPLGFGFRYNIKGPWTVGLELNYRMVLSDNIDNISGYYPLDIPQNNELPTIKIKTKEGVFRDFDIKDWQFLTDPSNNYPKKNGTLRGDGKKWDGYMTTNFTLTYTWRNTKCTW